MRLGRKLERADMTTRMHIPAIVNTQSVSS
jgi:uncharacterized alpha-E superfamily protein